MKENLINHQKDKESDDKLIWEYLYFSRAYSLMAVCGIHELYKKFANEQSDILCIKRNSRGEEIPDMTIEANFIIAPIAYNLKHSIELFIKAMDLFLGTDIQRNHNLKYLFENLRAKLKVTNDVIELEELIKKYYGVDFMIDKLISYLFINDCSNDIFRFPENSAKIRFNFYDVFSRFTKQDIVNIQGDIIKINNLFYNIIVDFWIINKN